MDQLGTFLRYIVPGLVFMVELLILLLLAHPDGMSTEKSEAYLKSLGSFTSLVTVTVVAAGIGYVSATIYHCFAWFASGLCPRWLITDHRLFLLRLQDRGWLRLVLQEKSVNAQETEVLAHALSIGGGWRVTSAIWFSRKGDDLKAPSERCEKLAHNMHSAGASLASAVLAGPGAWFVLTKLIEGSEVSFVLPAVVWASLVLAHFVGYCRVRANALGLVELILFEYVKTNYAISGMKFAVHRYDLNWWNRPGTEWKAILDQNEVVRLILNWVVIAMGVALIWSAFRIIRQAMIP